MTVQNYKILEYFKGSDQFYLADPNKVTIKKNGGKRWGVLKEFNLDLEPCLTGHLDGSLNKGVVLPPIRKSDNKCRWGAIDVDGEVYNILTENLTVKQVVDAIGTNIKKIKIKYVNNLIMNQLSYEVLNLKFKNKGFEFKGNYKRSIKKTINTLKNSNSLI